jgi:signal transduction histidine kinase
MILAGKLFHIKRLIFYVLLFLLPNVVIGNSENLSSKIEWLIIDDTTGLAQGTLDLATAEKKKGPIFGYLDNWVISKIAIDTFLFRGTNIYLEVENANLNEVYLLEKRNARFVKRAVAGDKISNTHKNIVHWVPVFSLPNKSEKEYYLLVRNEKRPLRIPVFVYTEKQWAKKNIGDLLFYGGFFGFIILLGLVLISLAVINRSNLYLTYALFIISYAFLPFVELGFAKLFLYPNQEFIEFHPLMVGTFFAFSFFLLFAYNALEVKKYFPTSAYRLRFVFTLNFLLFINWLLFPVFFRNYGVVFQNLFYLMMVVGFVMVWIIAVKSIKKKSLVPKLFLFAYAILTLFIFTYFAIDAGLISLYFYGPPPMLYSSLLESLILTVIVGARVSELNQDKKNLISEYLKLQDEMQKAIEGAKDHQKSQIARFLHDEFGSRLSFLNMALSRNSQKLEKALITQQIRELSEGIRNLSHQLDSVNYNNINEWLVAYVDQLNILEEIDFIIVENEPTPLYLADNKDVEMLIKEIVNNILKHANCTAVQFSLFYTDKFFTIYIKDNGIGFDDQIWRNKTIGGIASIKHRVNNLLGSISLTTAAGEGTSYEILFEK